MGSYALTIGQAEIFAEQRPDIASGLVRVVSAGTLVYLVSGRPEYLVEGELQQQNSQLPIEEGEK